MLALWHWHIEISSKCTLKCPRCARQEVPNGLVNTELSLDFFEKNFSPEFIKEHVRKITFCGDDGDPIYAHDLIEVIGYFKQHAKVEIVIVTNGSYKDREWWAALGSVLDEGDTVHFSLDGWNQDSNAQYRVNSDWISIMQGIYALRKNSQCIMIWDAIAFAFNQDHLDHMEELAARVGFDFIQITRSTKFGAVYPSYPAQDPLQPRIEWISQRQRFQREIRQLGKREWPAVHDVAITVYEKTQEKYANKAVTPLCASGGKGLFINSQGHFFPCCWVANRYAHNQDWLERGRNFDLTRLRLSDVLNDVFWSTEFQEFRWPECQNKCKTVVFDAEHALNW